MATPKKVKGIILTSAKMNDYDKRLVILTSELGKITAFLKGALRPNSPFIASSQVFTYAEFVIYEGKSAYNVTQIDAIEYFEQLSKDYKKAYLAMYFCELLMYFTKEAVNEEEELKLLYVTLRALIKGAISDTLIRCIFEYRLLTIEGFAAFAHECAGCGEKEVIAYDRDKNSFLCNACSKLKSKRARMLNTSTVFALQFIASQEIKRLYTFNVNEAVLSELIFVIGNEIKKNVDIEMKTKELIDII